MNFKTILKKNYFIYKALVNFRIKYKKLKSLYKGGNSIINNGFGKIYKDIIGSNNTIIIGNDSFLNQTIIKIRGNNNRIMLGKSCTVGPKCSFWLEGNNIEILIGDNTTFTHTVHFCAQEDNMSIVVGNDCMFSNSIIVRTSDSHPIYDNNNIRINSPRPVYIGNHVWIAPGARIMKGSIIHDNAIIGSNAFVTSEILKNALAVGAPAKCVKNNIYWTRESLF